MVVLTTNYVETLHKGMLRPGRLDAIINIGELDTNGVKKLIEVTLGSEKLYGDPPDFERIDWEAVYPAYEGYLPAFVVEAAGLAVRHQIKRLKGKVNGELLTTEDLIGSGHQKRRQYELMSSAKTSGDTLPLQDALQGVVEDALEKRLDDRILRDVEDF